ncbi:hypothetical protein L1887_62037 [Cichorium endivia]|nr:hypothetical protein L1887_62037 [Cichorium endivia]
MREAEIRARGGLARPSEVWLAVVRIYVIGAAFRTVLTGRGCAGTKRWELEQYVARGSTKPANARLLGAARFADAEMSVQVVALKRSIWPGGTCMCVQDSAGRVASGW